jgi:hypothetical protein
MNITENNGYEIEQITDLCNKNKTNENKTGIIYSGICTRAIAELF